MKISILIPSLESRRDNLFKLLDTLLPQLGYYKHVLNDNHLFSLTKYFNNEVEILIDVDNKQVSTGEKRNRLVKCARGKYVVFIDDDDEVPNYYVSELWKACESDADCIAINGTMTTDGAKEIKWRLSKDNENITIKENGVDLYLRKTNHITAVKREHALYAPFPDKSNAEDKAYSDAVNKYLKTEYTIVLPMYHYKFSTKNKEY